MATSAIKTFIRPVWVCMSIRLHISLVLSVLIRRLKHSLEAGLMNNYDCFCELLFQILFADILK